MFIRIVLIPLVLSCSVGLARADWIMLRGASSGDFTVYIDPSTHRIDKKTGLVKMLILYDLKTVPTRFQAPYLSMMGHEQYDCKEEQSRVLTTAFFNGHMAKGKVVLNSSAEGTWQTVAPGSANEALWTMACAIATKP